MAAVVVLAVLAACDSSGVQFIVYIPADYGADGDPAVQLPDEVRLFIGVGDEHAADLAPEGLAEVGKRKGTFWLRDPSNVPTPADPDLDRAPIGIDRPATFSFVRDGDVDELGIVVAVGYTNGVPTSSATIFHAQLGTGTVLQYRMGLNGAADPRKENERRRVNQLEIWGADECVHVNNRRTDIDDPGHAVAFIVGSKADRDCDGLIEGDRLECDADAHLGAGPSREPSCMAPSTADGICRIGAPRCQDGVGEDGSCSPTRYCAPPKLCTICSQMGDPWECAQNFQARESITVGGYGLSCRLPAQLVMTTNQLCTNPATALIIPPPGTTCEDVRVKGLNDLAFSDRFSIGGPGSAARIKITSQGCALTIEPSGMIPSTAGGGNFGALMLVDLDQQRGVAVPVYVELGASPDPGACSEAPDCRWIDFNPSTSPNACVGP